MGEMISKPDANPILLAVLNLFTWGFLGYFLLGQKKKAIMGLVIVAVGNICLMGLGFFAQLIFTYDVYLLAQKAANGESIGENENGLDFLNAIFK